jgi:hypothetical protein
VVARPASHHRPGGCGRSARALRLNRHGGSYSTLYRPNHHSGRRKRRPTQRS